MFNGIPGLYPQMPVAFSLPQVTATKFICKICQTSHCWLKTVVLDWKSLIRSLSKRLNCLTHLELNYLKNSPILNICQKNKEKKKIFRQSQSFSQEGSVGPSLKAHTLGLFLNYYKNFQTYKAKCYRISGTEHTLVI